MQTPTMLVVLDGFGYRAETYGNAVAHAQMPFWNSLCNRYPSALLHASGLNVGLPEGYIGNSEVGHMTLGAGRIVPSPLKLFDDYIESKKLFTNQMLIGKLKKLKDSGSKLHVMGLLSDAGVHSHENHLFALLELAHQCGLTQVYIHAFLDGRDVLPRSAAHYLEKLENECVRYKNIIASLHGRFYAMDRDDNWDRTKKSYDVLITKEHTPFVKSWREVLATGYKNGITDEFLEPQLLDSNGTISSGDGVIFFNFRPDRAQQLGQAFLDPKFGHFSNPCNTKNSTIAFFITPIYFSEAFKQLQNDALFEQQFISNTMLDVISQYSTPPKTIFAIAETEKYAHITYFFRGMQKKKLMNESYTLIPSIKAKDYSAYPEMSAPLITEHLIKSLRAEPAFFYLVNYANADMVGHSGNFSATVRACNILDQQLALLFYEVVERLKGTLCITADHGNAEQKLNQQGNMLTAHTTNPVPFVLASHKKYQSHIMSGLFHKQPEYGLSYVAPTLLKHMRITIPAEMEQKTIF